MRLSLGAQHELSVGLPEDFFIDVFSPTGDQYVEPRAGAPEAAAAFKKLAEARGTFTVSDLGQEYAPFLGPVAKKIEKYSATRRGSPMLGLVMYFCIAGDSFVGPALAYLHALAAIDDAFGLTQGPNVAEMKGALVDNMFGKEDAVSLIVHDISMQLAFLMIHADRLIDGKYREKTLLLINAGVVHSDFAWSGHQAIEWLRALAFEPIPP